MKEKRNYGQLDLSMNVKKVGHFFYFPSSFPRDIPEMARTLDTLPIFLDAALTPPCPGVPSEARPKSVSGTTTCRTCSPGNPFDQQPLPLYFFPALSLKFLFSSSAWNSHPYAARARIEFYQCYNWIDGQGGNNYKNTRVPSGKMVAWLASSGLRIGCSTE